MAKLVDPLTTRDSYPWDEWAAMIVDGKWLDITEDVPGPRRLNFSGACKRPAGARGLKITSRDGRLYLYRPTEATS